MSAATITDLRDGYRALCDLESSQDPRQGRCGGGVLKVNTTVIKSLQNGYAELTALERSQDTGSLSALTASNAELGRAVNNFRGQLSSTFKKLPNDKLVFSEEYDCLCRLADLNGVDRELVFRGVVDVENWRVVILQANGKGLKDITPLAGLTGLRHLEMQENGICDLRPLSGLIGLQELWLSFNKIVDLHCLSGLTGLKTLSLGHNNIEEIGVLSRFTSLRWLYLACTRVSDISALSGLTALEELDVAGNLLLPSAEQVLKKLQEGGAKCWFQETFK